MSNIISRLPGSFWVEVESRVISTGSGILMLILEMAFSWCSTMATIMLIQAIEEYH
jgi:hypothetical protein